MNNEDLYRKNAANLKNKIAKVAILLSGDKGVLKAVDNESLNGDTKKKHAKATEEASQFKNKDGSIEPEIQAIYARMYGLI